MDDKFASYQYPLHSLHGENDQNVILTHSKLMQQKMLESKQDMTLYVAKGGQHGSGGLGWGNHNQVVFDFFNKKMQSN